MMITSFAGIGRNFGRPVKGKNTLACKLHNNVLRLDEIHNRMKDVLIENADWRKILKDFDSEDAVHYLDPPYLNVSCGAYTHDMSKHDHEELLYYVFECKGLCAVSSYENPLYDSMPWDKKIKWDSVVTIEAMAFTDNNHKADMENHAKRNTAKEVLYIKE
jgi:DNA adenine methylase